LRQVGSVRQAFESSGPIPAITLGAEDGRLLTNALTDPNAAQDVRAAIGVGAASVPAAGQNGVGRIGGGLPDEVVLRARYDTWFVGSSDNGGGVAAVLALAARRLAQEKPKYTLVFVAYDGEEVALYGGYDFLHRHRILSQDPILAVINYEVPSAAGATFLGLA